MFLKYNERFWGDELVADAIRSTVSDGSKIRLNELTTQVEFDVDFSDTSDDNTYQ